MGAALLLHGVGAGLPLPDQSIQCLREPFMNIELKEQTENDSRRRQSYENNISVVCCDERLSR